MFSGLGTGRQGGDVLENSVAKPLVHGQKLPGAGTRAARFAVVGKGWNHVELRGFVENHGHDPRYLGIVPGFDLEKPLQVGIPLPQPPDEEPAHGLRVEGFFFVVLEDRKAERKLGIEKVFPEQPGAEAVNRPYGSGEKLAPPVARYVSKLPVGLDVSSDFPPYPGLQLRRGVLRERDGDYLRHVRLGILENLEILGYYGPGLSGSRPGADGDSRAREQYSGLLVV